MQKTHCSIGILLFCLQLLSACASQPNDDFQCQSCDAYPAIKRISDCPVAAPSARWDHLVFQGGGVKGIAYGGALEELDRRGHLEPVQRVAGTSAGAITATLLAIGHNACEVSRYAKDFPYNNFEDGKGFEEVPRLLEDYGLYKGDFFRCSMRCLVEDSLGSKDASFKTLARRIDHDKKSKKSKKGRALKHLYVVATDLSTMDAVTFSHESPHHGDVAIADAVRKSMSIPLIFTAQTLPPSDHRFVDGGVVRNYPIDIFDDKIDPEAHEQCLLDNAKHKERCTIKRRTLGMHVSEGRKDFYETDDIFSFTKQLFNTITASQIDVLCASPDNVERTVFIDTFDITATDFYLTKDQKDGLTKSGRKHMARYLDEPPGLNCPEFILPRTAGIELD